MTEIEKLHFQAAHANPPSVPQTIDYISTIHPNHSRLKFGEFFNILLLTNKSYKIFSYFCIEDEFFLLKDLKWTLTPVG